jgi:hypothetical protein
MSHLVETNWGREPIGINRNTSRRQRQDEQRQKDGQSLPEHRPATNRPNGEKIPPLPAILSLPPRNRRETIITSNRRAAPETTVINREKNIRTTLRAALF